MFFSDRRNGRHSKLARWTSWMTMEQTMDVMDDDETIRWKRDDDGRHRPPVRAVLGLQVHETRFQYEGRAMGEFVEICLFHVRWIDESDPAVASPNHKK
jgi:hypothetical protein